MPDTIERLADSITDNYRDTHGSTSFLHVLAGDERQSIALALGWVEVALASLKHHQNTYERFGLCDTADAMGALVDARDILTERGAALEKLS